jgi:hypothetical protein
MNLLSITIAALGLLVSVSVALIPYIRKVFFIGPELTIELIPNGGSSANKGYSRKNDMPHIDEFIDSKEC